jgi:hypothetical protein
VDTFKLPEGQKVPNAKQFEQMAATMADPANDADIIRADVVARLRDAATLCKMVENASEMQARQIATGAILSDDDSAAIIGEVVMSLVRLAQADDGVMKAANLVHAFSGQADVAIFKRRLVAAVEAVIPNTMGIDRGALDALLRASA